MLSDGESTKPVEMERGSLTLVVAQKKVFDGFGTYYVVSNRTVYFCYVKSHDYS